MKLTLSEIAILEEAQEANPFYFAAMMKAVSIMSDRVKKYSGKKHPYFNFVDLAKRTRQEVGQVFNFYYNIKSSRTTVSGGQDFGDESFVDTLIDMVNYLLLWVGWIIAKLKPEDVIPEDDQHADRVDFVDRCIALDFDGVFNQYVGWTGKYEFPAERPGIYDFLEALKDHGYNIVVWTARPDIDATIKWLEDRGLAQFISKVTVVKPVGMAYLMLDDRAIQFNGNFNEALEQIVAFEPYWGTESHVRAVEN